MGRVEGWLQDVGCYQNANSGPISKSLNQRPTVPNNNVREEDVEAGRAITLLWADKGQAFALCSCEQKVAFIVKEVEEGEIDWSLLREGPSEGPR